MKILMLNVTSEVGGGTQQAYLLCRGLVTSAVDITYVAPDNGPYFAKIRPIVQDVVDLNLRKLRVKSLLMLRNIIRSRKIDLIHSHGRGAGFYSRLLSMMLGVPSIHTFHGIHYGKYHNFFTRWGLKSLENALARFSFNIFVSSTEQAMAQRFRLKNFFRDSTIIPNGIEISRYKPAMKQEEFFRDNSRNLSIITLAQINWAKGIDRLVDAAADLKNAGVRFMWTVYGEQCSSEKSYIQKIKNQIKMRGLQKVFILGGVTDQVVTELAAADIYVSGSRWEGLPLAILEAMASGTLVIASNVSGNNVLIQSERNGFLVDPDRFPQRVQEIMYRLMDGPGLAVTMARQALEDVQQYDVRNMVKAYEFVYNQQVTKLDTVSSRQSGGKL